MPSVLVGGCGTFDEIEDGHPRLGLISGPTALDALARCRTHRPASPRRASCPPPCSAARSRSTYTACPGCCGASAPRIAATRAPCSPPRARVRSADGTPWTSPPPGGSRHPRPPPKQKNPPKAGTATGSGPAGPRRRHAEYPLTPPVLDRTGKLTCLTLTNSKADPALIRSLSEPGHGHLEELAFRARLLVPSSQPPELPPLLGRSARPPCLLHPGRLGTPSCGWKLGRRLELPSELFGDYSYVR